MLTTDDVLGIGVKDKRLYDVISVRKIGKRFKVVHMKSQVAERYISYPPGSAGNDKKYDEAISRAYSSVLDLGLCNPWEYFVTLTLDPKKWERYTLDEYRKALSKWLRHYRERKGANIKYLLVPERHKDGAWHMHGMIFGLPEEHLTRNDYGYLDWRAYSDKFGFINLGKIRNDIAVSLYVSKYVRKSMTERADDVGQHLYYASRGLNRSELLGRVHGTPQATRWKSDYYNEHCRTAWIGESVAQRILDEGNPLMDGLSLPTGEYPIDGIPPRE